jgi:hypothetical protein
MDDTRTAPERLPGLLPHHVAELRASGLSDETIRRAGIRSEENNVSIAQLLCRDHFPKKCGPCLVFPYHDGKGINGYYRAKPDVPRLLGGKPVKYESPVGYPNELYYPPNTIPILTDATVELLFTEGEKKALSASQHGFQTVGLVGVFGWTSKGKSVLPANVVLNLEISNFPQHRKTGFNQNMEHLSNWRPPSGEFNPLTLSDSALKNLRRFAVKQCVDEGATRLAGWLHTWIDEEQTARARKDETRKSRHVIAIPLLDDSTWSTLDLAEAARMVNLIALLPTWEDSCGLFLDRLRIALLAALSQRLREETKARGAA